MSFSGTIITPTIAVSGSPILLGPYAKTPLSIKNISASTATAIQATIPAGLNQHLTQDASNCASLAPGASCQLVFTATDGTAYSSTALPIAGSNTNTVTSQLGLGLPYVANNIVNKLALDTSTNTLYMGGTFTAVGPNTGTGVPVDATSGLPENNYARVGMNIRAVVPDGTGGWYIGGAFNYVNNTSRSRIAHILSDGTLDANFNFVLNATGVFALALKDNILYAGGDFTTVNGATQRYVAAINTTTGGLVANWNPNPNAAVYTLATQGSTLYMGGNFTTVNGAAHLRIAAVDISTGTPNNNWNPGVNAIVYSIALSNDTIFVGGSFTQSAGQTINGLAAFDLASGALKTTWNANLIGGATVSVTALLYNNNVLYAGGNFSFAGGLARSYIAAFDPTNGALVTSWDANAGNIVNTLAVNTNTNTLYVGGSFVTMGGQPRNRIAAVALSNGQLITSWDPNANNVVNAIGLQNNLVYLGGAFSSVGGAITRNRLAAIDIATGLPTSWNPNLSGPISAIAFDNNNVYVGGNFTTVGGVSRNNFAALSKTNGTPNVAWPDATGGAVASLLLTNDTLYLGGAFTTVGGQARSRLAALNLSSGTLITSWNPNVTGTTVSAMTYDFSANAIYVGGTFTAISGATRSNLASVDATSGQPNTWDPQANNSVTALLQSGSTLYVGGAFTTMGGITRNSAAAFNMTTSTGTLNSWNPNATAPANNGVFTIGKWENVIFIGGFFNGIVAGTSNLASVDASLGTVSSWRPNLLGSANSIIVNGSTVFGGGMMTGFNTEVSGGVGFIPQPTP